MKYTNEIIIDVPREEVIKLFDNPDNMKHWQEGFQSLEHMSGEPGTVGAKSKLSYIMDKRHIQMIETITVRNLPDEFSGIYEAKGVWNEVKNFFTEVEGGKTKWTSECEFRFKGFMKIIAFLFPGSFKKQSMKFLIAFKKFAEAK